MHLTYTSPRVFAFLLLLAFPVLALAQAGKIAGTITDGATGEPLPGVNVAIEGTLQGTTTDADGYYVILNVKPGTYQLRASFVGFTPYVVADVRVQIDQTTQIDMVMQEVVLEGEEVVVTAERPVVQRDVANSQLNVSAEQIEALPVTSVTTVLALQAGVVQGEEGTLLIRGGGANEASLNLNGLNLRNGRNNVPFTTIPLSSISEVQVQTGGFGVEYGNARSGVVNVITKEGDPSGYEAAFSFQFSPPTDKHFGPAANDLDSYWIRPYLDEEVAFVGTDVWPQYLQNQYPSFEGWIAVSEQLVSDGDPTNDLTPEALQQAFLWQHRKELEITSPDYTLDLGFGGPVPFLNKYGRTRFYASYRQDQSMYVIPLHTDSRDEQVGHLKITSDVARGMKLSVEGMYGRLHGTASSRSGQPGMFSTPGSIASDLSGVSFIDTRIFSTDYWTPSTTRSFLIGGSFSHAISNRSFYELRYKHFRTTYDTNPGRLRDETPVVFFGGVGFDEAPFGWQRKPTFGVDGMRTGVGMSNSRDSSKVAVNNFFGMFTSQMTPVLEVKLGGEVNVSRSEVNYANVDSFLTSGNSQSKWDRTPVDGGLFAAAKLEFKGMIASAGLRMSYYRAGGDWFVYDPYTPAFSAAQAAGLDTLLSQEPTEGIVEWLPTLGVAFPITSTSKLFFNYFHTQSLPDPNVQYLVRQFSETGQVSLIGNPNSAIPKTVGYEVGFEQSLLEQYLVRVSGYYRDKQDDPATVNYVSRNAQTDYLIYEPNSYADIRGFELTLEKNRGPWVRGFLSYTYQVTTAGRFGLPVQFENQIQQQRYIEENITFLRQQSRPIPRPFARANVHVFSPRGFGPEVMGFHPLAGWNALFLGRWSTGAYYTWPIGNPTTNNLQTRPFYTLDLRLGRSFSVGKSTIDFYMDVSNLLNRRTLSFSGFVNGTDRNAYFRSLHLPANEDWDDVNIPGDDRVGDFRKDGVAYQPMELAISRDNISDIQDGVIYYERDTATYIEYVNGNWQNVDGSRLRKILDDKAYIDMPNQSFLTFLNPRDVYFGIRVRL